MGIMKFVHWFRSEPHRAKYGVDHPAFLAAKETWDYQQARIEALEKLLDPETLARKIGDWDFRHNSDYFCFKFGGDGDNGEMLIEAIAAILQKEE